MEQTTDIQELSLEKVIETKLVQSNVTDQVLAALKEKYGGMKLKSVDDKESYLEIKAAAKECAKVRTLTVSICKKGREDAVKTQKAWIAKEKEVIGKVAEVEDVLDIEIAKFDDEVDRKANEEKKRQEDAYINRQAILTKMGATYSGGSFILGEASFESELVKGSSQDVWEEAIVPKFQAEYNKIEAVRIEQERQRAEREAEMKRQQEDILRQQQEIKEQQEEMQRQRDETIRIQKEAEEQAEKKERIRVAELVNTRSQVLRGLGMSYDGSQYDFADIYISRNQLSTLAEKEWTELVSKTTVEIKSWKDAEAKRQEEKRLADIEVAKQEAIKKEQERQAEETRLAEIKKQQDAAKKVEELAQATDKVKYANLIQQLQAIEIPDMRSGQYRRKVAVIREKIEEIYSL